MYLIQISKKEHVIVLTVFFIMFTNEQQQKSRKA